MRHHKKFRNWESFFFGQQAAVDPNWGDVYFPIKGTIWHIKGICGPGADFREVPSSSEKYHLWPL